ncbi:MAG: hypothetical protein K9K79_03640 [Desulfohalobiaceae bacterium]|nr:hypothetical protein [Desulfohalobiaceae bacterium]
MNRSFFFLLIFALLTGIPAVASAQTGFTQQDRELLIKLNVKVEQMEERFEQIDLRFKELREDMNKRFEQVDKRFEQVDKRFEQVNMQFEQVQTQYGYLIKILVAVILAFAGIVGANIAIVVWDRRSMTKPFEEKTKKMEDEILENKERIASLIKALRELAPHDQKLAEILRSFSLL